jgi:SAM-dependent methyltransferase
MLAQKRGIFEAFHVTPGPNSRFVRIRQVSDGCDPWQIGAPGLTNHKFKDMMNILSQIATANTVAATAMLTPKRIYEEELLDAGEGTDADVAGSLVDLRRINQFLGGKKVLLRALSSCLDRSNSKAISLLDVGTGSADLPMAIAAKCKQRSITAFIAAVDISERNLRIARGTLGVSPDIHLVRADSLKLPFADRSFDFVTASLFLHHFRDDDVVRLLWSFARIAKRAVIVNDLVRNLVPYYFTKIAGPVLAKSFLTRNDGPVSILRGFTPAEMNELARRAGLDTREVKRIFPYRLSLVADVSGQ